jgi:hypothetical protein
MNERTISIGGAMIGSAAVTGDNATVSTRFQRIEFPPIDTVDILATIAALRGPLGLLDNACEREIDAAMTEAAKSQPDRDRIGKALERALGHARTASGFAEQIEKLAPHVVAAVSWLGRNWHRLLTQFGIAT